MRAIIAMAMITIVVMSMVGSVGWADCVIVGEGATVGDVRWIFCSDEVAVGAGVEVEVSIGVIGEDVGAGVIAWVGVGVPIGVGVGIGEGVGTDVGLGVIGGGRPVAKTLIDGAGE